MTKAPLSSRAQRRRHRMLVAQGFLPLALACYLAVPAWASSKSTNQNYLLRDGITAIADLDGDQIPDTASSIRIDHTEQGYSYRVDLGLSSDANAASFTVLSDEPSGLNIEAIDVDGDHDLDLVVTSNLLHRPVALWINDGKGRFTPGDPAQYSSVFWQARYSVDPAGNPNPHVLTLERRRPTPVTLNSNPVVCPTGSSSNTARFSSVLRLPLFPNDAWFRGPPPALFQ